MAEVTTPIALIVFRRTDTLQKVVKELNKHSIKELFIIADGPRTPADEQETHAARELAETVQADRVKKIYSEKNLGLKKNLTTGVTRAFENTNQLIILEDDCLPSSGFFDSCNNLSKQMDNALDIAGFCGSTSLPYVFKQGLWRSQKFNVWGWLANKKTWSDFIDSGFLNYNSKDLLEHVDALSPLPFLAQWEMKRLIRLLDQLDTWDVQFETFCLKNGRAFLKPKKNLVQNIGFGLGATHTSELGASLSRKISQDEPVVGTLTLENSKLFDLTEHTWKFVLLSAELVMKTLSRPFR